MFTDFASFSTLTQSMDAMEVVEALNFYFKELIGIVKQSGGFPDKYTGDAIVAIFDAPVPLEDHAERAALCAIQMQRCLRRINDARRAEGKLVFEMRIGLNSGHVVVGAIGCDDKLEYTSIGETTNLANRMESAAAIGHVAIAEETYRRIDISNLGHVAIDIPIPLEVKGYPQPVMTSRVWVSPTRITKNANRKSAADFYIYEEADKSQA
jgi:class 3 adenylate cyclase